MFDLIPLLILYILFIFIETKLPGGAIPQRNKRGTVQLSFNPTRSQARMSSSSTRTSTTAHSSGSRSSFSSIASTTTTSTTSDSPFFVTTFTNAPSQTAAPVGTSTISGTGKVPKSALFHCFEARLTIS